MSCGVGASENDGSCTKYRAELQATFRACIGKCRKTKLVNLHGAGRYSQGWSAPDLHSAYASAAVVHGEGEDLARNCQSEKPNARHHVKLQAVVPDRIRPIAACRPAIGNDRNAAIADVRERQLCDNFGNSAS